jgi:methyl-accepting chemotaxis protein
MTLKQRIWLLPLIAALASVLSIGINYVLSHSASKVLAAAGSQHYPAVNNANALLATVSSLEEALKYAVSAGDKEGLGTLEQKAAAFRQLVSELGKLPGKNEVSARLGQQFDVYFSAASESAAIMLGIQQGDLTGIVQTMQGAQATLRKTLSQNKAMAVRQFEQSLSESQAAIREQLWVGMLQAFAVIFGIAFASYLLIPSIMKPIKTVVGIAQSMARGDLSGEIEVTGKDEMAQLLGAMQEMVHSFNRFVAAQQELAERHASGDIDHVIPAQQFPGIYGEMARSTNELARSHIAVTQRVLDVVTHYAVGDLSVDMDPLPGQQARIKTAMDGVKHSLQAINGEIVRLVEAATRGDFQARGNAARYQHDFHQMVIELNRLMEVSDTGLSEIARVLAALAEGDLTERVGQTYQGTFAQLKDDANTTVEKLTEIVLALQNSAEAIGTISGDGKLSHHSAKDARRAATMDSTASALEELTATVKHNADGAARATELAIAARSLAEEGGSVTHRAVLAVEEINHSSRQIADIIGVIDDIAFQTNLLALNAAVEAARAGEQGRGFAVVANEVRSLAGRSKSAAKQIKDLIEDSARKVSNGSQLVNESGQKLLEIVDSVKKVTEIVGEIATASREQAVGIEQVNQAMTDMDQVMQRNAGELAKAVAVFKVARHSNAENQTWERAS